MFRRYLDKLKLVPQRGEDWASRMGPVALMGISGSIPNSGTELVKHTRRLSPDCDMYACVKWHDKGPIEAPPSTVSHLPVLDCGTMSPEGGSTASSDDWYVATQQATMEVYEKGYIPVNAGGGGEATLAMLEAIKRVSTDDNITVFHFGANSFLGAPLSPLRIAAEKGLAPRIVSIGNRMVDSDTRRHRREHKMHFMDCEPIYQKGINGVRDVRNDYNMFISIDIGALDPAFAPAVRSPESGGLTVRELLHLLHTTRGPRVVGVDVHGYDPALDICRPDGVGLTAIAGAKVIKEAILKAYSVTTMTQDEGVARFTVMHQEGKVSHYPEF